ncbi:hypothetical protein KY290_036760 [Solanum tuberosum]|uniref:Integrase core domain containing protein n=1 Tax=Solanum tuberosum TaxID=4113 RepID=A0ABQ7TU64_SOLTU|nr:hypothetical protein KY289_036246 [Solanum tuberosum]KAH0639494.1 hypothetical protein KY285_036080 [Solanum tuberosum]KAH0738055.1 hypothetical protein KY290_036760 [Solanum tuberosum]
MPDNERNADSTGSNPNLVVQFNPVSQLPIKIVGIHNFSTWKAHVSTFMRGHNLFGLLNGSSPAPLSTITENSRENAIVASIDPTIASTVAAASTAQLAWDSLHLAYANNLRDQIARLSKGSLPVTNYLHQVRSICNELATAGARVTYNELVVKILSGLGSDFREISAAFRARDSIILYNDLYAKLIDYELLLKHEELKKEPPAITAAMVTHNRSLNSNNRTTRRPNNNSQWLPNNRPNAPAQGSYTNNHVRCQLYNRQGHTANVCRSQSHNHIEAKAIFLSGNHTPAN